MIFSSPPQFGQCSMSISNTRLSRPAQPHRGLHDGLRGGEPVRSQAAHGLAIALSGAHLRLPACGCLNSDGHLQVADGARMARKDARKLPVASAGYRYRLFSGVCPDQRIESQLPDTAPYSPTPPDLQMLLVERPLHSRQHAGRDDDQS